MATLHVIHKINLTILITSTMHNNFLTKQKKKTSMLNARLYPSRARWPVAPNFCSRAARKS